MLCCVVTYGLSYPFCNARLFHPGATHLTSPCASATVFLVQQGPNPYDEVDILVHCDVGIFEWLFEYIHSTGGRSSSSCTDKNDHSHPSASGGGGGSGNGSGNVDIVEATRPKAPLLKVLFCLRFLSHRVTDDDIGVIISLKSNPRSQKVTTG